jgi:DNA-binding transcriptional regulator YiaG
VKRLARRLFLTTRSITCGYADKTRKLNDMTTVAELVDRVEARQELPPPALRRALRRAAGVSLDDVGAAVGVTGQAVWWWEQGKREPNDENLVRYLELLRELKRLVTP